MKKTFLILVLACSISWLQSCEKDTTFLITESSVGPLLKTSSVSELESIFVQDSIVKDTGAITIGEISKKVKVFEKGGKHLMTLTTNSDSIPTVENIRIFDARYSTSKGIGLSSTFQDIQQSYSIKKIVTTLNSVVIFPKSSNLYFTIDKEELPSNLRYTTSNIEAVQIPGTAKIKYLMVGWE
ncbi:hypothetical protein [Flagellimonas nanhaiensis]|uniref:Uncharacterized protein n=1 Tax=Flagellimonas nanhaiensis TaxID=2292706 RepID=A0A371JSG6_9FLAO|nr:hypothetical protein [Allomuricauda nanhaiensis]RDY60741.1 hypothetical protein DX873_00735 [Allomuricauda nanhaiensis]